jgi:hypothetical protein
LLASPTIREIAESLADDEAVVVLGAGLEAMLAAVIVRGDNNVPTGRLLRTEWSWAWLAEKVIGDVSDGWFLRRWTARGANRPARVAGATR